MRRFVMAAVSIAAVGLAPVMVFPGQAAGGATRTVSTTDPIGDVDSRLDIVFAKFRDNGDGTATLTIRTAESWGCRYLRGELTAGDTASAQLFWDFDEGANGSFDVAGRFVCDHGFNFEFGHRSGSKVYSASRPSAHSARVTFPLSELRGSQVLMRAMSRVSGVIGNDVFVDEEDVAPPLLAY